MDASVRFAISSLQSTWILGLVLSNNNTCSSWKEPKSHFIPRDTESQCSEGRAQCEPVNYAETQSPDPHLAAPTQEKPGSACLQYTCVRGCRPQSSV